jgi:hypothetical protein
MAKSLLSTGRKKKASRTAKSVDEQYLGVEPVWDDSIATSSQLASAYNWYNYFGDIKSAAKMLFTHYPRNKTEIKVLRKLDDKSISPILGYNARMMSRGCKLPKDFIERFNQKIEELLDQATVIEEIVIEKKVAYNPSVQDRIREQISDYIGEIENEVDLFSEGGYKSEFSMYAWLQQNNVKSQQSNAIAEYYVPWRNELKEAIAKKDEQLVEGYSNMKPAQLKKFVEFLDGIIKDATTWGANQKTVRKTRTKKAPSIEKQIAKIQYAKESKEYKLVSVNPALIIGCNQLWVFNTKYRKLMRYDALGPAGLSIKGTTLQGYDEEASVSKTIRKPDEVLPRLLKGGKLVLRKLMSEINSKESVPNGRINGDTILLRVIK